MNTKTAKTVERQMINLKEYPFFNTEIKLWGIFSLILFFYWSNNWLQVGAIDILFKIAVVVLLGYAIVMPFAKSWYNLGDLNSAIYKIAGIGLIIAGSIATKIYGMPWGENLFMAGFVSVSYYHWLSPFREKTYRNINAAEEKLIWLFAAGSLLCLPACFMHLDLFPYPNTVFYHTAALGSILLIYTVLSSTIQWYQKTIRNYVLLSYAPRILLLLYFAKGYTSFMLFFQ